MKSVLFFLKLDFFPFKFFLDSVFFHFNFSRLGFNGFINQKACLIN